MSSCCVKRGEMASGGGTMVVALAGNPNSGKTTIFNALTGLRQKVANYPGVTVEKKTGRSKLGEGRWCDVIDLPGTYSLISRSPDELVAMEVLRGLREGTKAPDVVVVVVDGSNLQRNLYLVSQLVELGRPLVVALNMMDIAERRGLHVSAEGLSGELGVPVVPVVGHKKKGIVELKEAIGRAAVAPLPDWALPEAMREEIVLVGGGLAILDSDGTAFGQKAEGSGARGEGSGDEGRLLLDRYQVIAERLLVGDGATDLAELAGREPVRSLLVSAGRRMEALGIDPMQADIEAHYRWVEGVVSRSMATLEELAAMGNAAPSAEAGARERQTWTERIDGFLIHRVWGLMIFATIMGLLFAAIFWAAQPIMDAIRVGVHWLGDVVAGWLPETGPVRALVSDGIFGGVGTVVVFVPQIAMLFGFLAVLEDSGYLARAAFLMDRVLGKVGLHGKSFIPLLSSFACAIPGIMATRTIDGRKDRLATILVAPFMSCSARLPVYTLLIGTFFAGYGAVAQAGMMLGLYVLGIVAATGVAFLFRRTLLRGSTAAFIMEMPSYKMPQVGHVARQVYLNTREFITKAGTIIFCMSVILWALMYYPGVPANETGKYQDGKALAAARLHNSFAGKLGHGMEGAIRPLGYDWKMGVGLVGAFAAREVFVSTMGIVYSVGDPGEAQTDLSEAMRRDVYPDGRPVWTGLSAVSLLVWFVLAMQCMSTVAIVRRETGGWRWPIFMLVYMNALAYVVCLVVYQVGSRLVG